MTDPSDKLFDVIATNIKTGKHRIMDVNKTEPNAAAFINIAVMRLGVEEEFYSAVKAGSVRND